MKTLLGFDSWTQGSKYFERLVPELEQRGYRLILIHLGSWGHDADRSAEEQIGRLLVRDISYYRGKDFRRILQDEQPAGVIFFSTRSLAHQAFNLQCRSLGIPTIHLYHGLVAVQAVQSCSGGAFRLHWWNQLNLVRTRLAKNLFTVWPIYWRALIETRAPVPQWLAFWKELLDKLRARITPAPLAASTDSGCVYTIADLGHMHWAYHVPADRIAVVGNPDLAGFGMSEEELGHGLSPRANITEEVIYIDTAFGESGMVFADGEDFVRHLENTAKALLTQRLRLVAKLHPAHGRTTVPDRLRASGVALCGRAEFVGRLKRARGAIAEPSTAALIPALLGIPLLLAEYGPLTGQAYGDVLTSYPRAARLIELAEIRQHIDRLEATDTSEKTRGWIERNSGPLPASMMPARAAEAIVETVERRGAA